MILRSATGVLLTLVFCTAENNEPRWSRPDQDLRQGEWVPLNSERLSQEPNRVQSAIQSPPQQINHALLRSPSPNQFDDEYQPKQIFGSHSVPPRIALLHPQSLSPQPLLQSQIPSQQLLTQFLNHQIEQGSLPIFSRALLHGQPSLTANYEPQQVNYNLKPNYNQIQDFQNVRYRLDAANEAGGRIPVKEEAKEDSVKANPFSKPAEQISNDSNNKESEPSEQKEKEEVQILYVPVEMLKQQEQARNAAKRFPVQNENPSVPQNSGNLRANHETAPTESRKFRHPIQPLKEQVPAHHLRDTLSDGKLISSYTSKLNDDSSHSHIKQRGHAHNSQRASALTRNEPVSKLNTNNAERLPYTLKNEQLGDESSVQDEVSAFRNPQPTRRTPARENINRSPTTTLPPPNQPPLSVFMETTSNNQVGDVLSLLKESKTIPVLDSIGPDAPQVFVGPSNLNTPLGYIKYELPYLSSLGTNAGHKLSQVPFFVAPLNFQPPPGFAKIPFPPPHIGSVVLSNLSNHGSFEESSSPTPPSFLQHTPDYKDPFTIPADISSISPQLPSLINSLQEENFAAASSTEALPEPTEEPTQRYRRPTSSRRQNNRGSYRESSSSSTTTRRPSTRQRRPPSRYSQRNQLQDSREVTSDKSYESQHSTDNNYFTTKSNRRPEHQEALTTVSDQVSNRPEMHEHHVSGIQFSNNPSDEKQEQRNLEPQKENYFTSNPTLLNYPTEESLQTNHGRTTDLHQPGRSENIEQPLGQSFHGTRNSGQLQYPSDSLHPPTTSGVSQIENTATHPQAQDLGQANFADNYDQNSYQSASQFLLQNGDNGPSKQRGYEEYIDRQNSKEQIDNPEGQNHQHNIRNQNRFIESHGDTSDEAGPEKFSGHQQDIALNDGQNQQRYVNENPKVINTPHASYQDVQNDHLNEQHNLRESSTQGKQLDSEYMQNYQNHPTNTGNYENSDAGNNYESIQTQKRITERPVPVRTRSRFRGKTYNQVQQTQPTMSTHSYNYDEEPERNNHSKNRITQSPDNSEDYVQGSSYSTTNDNYPSHYTTEQTDSPPSRRLPHGRAGRRPLRPTARTTIATTSTTTSPPPGKKYLIRTRRPAVAQTKLQTGRGRIRKPTTPTTTTTTTTQSPVTIITTEHPRTLPFQWRQPVQEDYSIKEENNTPALSALEYQRESPQYQEIRESDVQLNVRDERPQHNVRDERPQHSVRDERPLHSVRDERPQHSVRDERPQHSVRDERPLHSRHHSQTRGDSARRVPNYSSASYEEDNYPLQKQYERPEGNSYRTNYERTRRPHVTREYETTRKPQEEVEYEATQKPYYSRDYEATQKPHYSRDQETTQRTFQSRDQETTQNIHYTREYEPTQKPFYSRDQESTRMNHYTKEYETTPKPQFSPDYDAPEKPQYYKNYETPQTKNQEYQEPEQVQNSPQYEEYEATNKPIYNYDVETTRKPQAIREHSTTRRSPVYQDYEPTQSPYISREEKPSRTHTSTSTRNNHHSLRRRPTTTAKEEAKTPKYQETEAQNSKDPNADFWNQAVTIQQSQSFVYTPDGNLAPTEEQSSESNAKQSSLPSDYEDYYNFQGGQYTSDQSPFPSNDQHVTYTKFKPNQEVGKASQYPDKNTFEKLLPDEIVLEPEITPQNVEETENKNQTEGKDETLKLSNDSETNKEQPLVPLAEQEPAFEQEHLYKESQSPTKTGRRRGTWVRVRVKKPKDVFETAESQRFSSIRENALIPEEPYPKVAGDKPSTHKPESNKTEVSVTESATDLMTDDSKGKDSSIGGVTEQTKTPEVSTSNDSTQTSESAYTTITNTETGTQNNVEEDVTTMSSTLLPQEVATVQTFPENLRTSTTTEISLETEICYKGQCIKTKRRKNDSNWGLQLTE